MATLVLTTVGSVIGGPVGGALGALVGQGIDSALFKPARRQGPRLGDLTVQTSSYGTAIPRLFGTLRVAGTVIWSTDLIEHRTSSGGGKRSAGGDSYSYSASFAVALSGRPIRNVRRMWADGKLLRGAAGDFKSATLFRLHLGDEAQAVDPLIGSLEGAATPAHRGIAYAVFEDMALADFGNRIPSLTFEVEADAGPVGCGEVLAELSDRNIADEGLDTQLGGYAGYGGSVREVAAALTEASGAWFAVRDDGRLSVRAGGGVLATIVDDGAGGARAKRAIAAADSAPRVVSLQYHDPARDYQSGLQRAAQPGAGSREMRIDLPAALEAGAAKAMAAAALDRADRERERRSVALDWRWMAVQPGDRVRIDGEAGSWRVTGWTLEAMVLTLELVRIGRPTLAATATPGRVLTAPDATAGATIVHAFELPSLDEAVRTGPRLMIAATGTGPGWRRAAVQISRDGGGRWTPAGTAGSTVLGWVAVPAAAAGSALVDRRHAIEVTLARDDMLLSDADASALDQGSNLCMVGDEIVQFGRAERIGARRWRLSELWRGRRGTEWAAGTTNPGDRFALLEGATLLAVDLPIDAIGARVDVLASGVGDTDPARTSVSVSGAALVPPAPVHLNHVRQGAIDILRWTRRSRNGWRWIDGVDVPLVEEAEAYSVTLIADDGSRRVIDTASPEWSGPSVGLASVTVSQRGAGGLSRPAAAVV